MAIDTPLFDPRAAGVFADRFAGPDVTPADPTPFALDGVPFVRLTLQGIYGTLTIGPSTVPIRLSPPVDGTATIDVGPGKLTLDAISAAGPEPASTAAVDPRAILPPSLAAAVGGAVVSHVRVRVDLTGRRLTAVGLDVVGDRPWTLLPGRLVVTDLNLSVNVYPHGAAVQVSGALTGTIILGGTSVPVVASPVNNDRAVRGDCGLASETRTADPVGTVGSVTAQAQAPIGADAGWWLVLMDSVDGIPLSSLRDLAGLLDADGIDGLLSPGTGSPAPPTDSALDGAVDPAAPHPPVLTGLAIRVAPSSAVESVAITLDMGPVAAPRGSGDGTIGRTAVVDRRRRAEQVNPVVSVATQGRVHRGPPAS